MQVRCAADLTMALFYTSCGLFLDQVLIYETNIIHDNEGFSQTFVTFAVGLAAVCATKVFVIINLQAFYMCSLTSCVFFSAACMALV